MKKLDIWKSNTTAPNTGNIWYTNGELKVFENGWKPLLKAPKVVNATANTAGLVKQAIAEEQLDKKATLDDVVKKLNAVIVKLKAAGIMA